MNHPRIKMSKLALGLVVALAAAPAFAQSTSAGVGGQVTSAGGQPVAGAEVTITHVESGTVSRATTDAAGRYNARGLRVGGPYTVTITKPGEGTKTEDGIYLGVNQNGTVNAALTGDLAATNLEAVQVMAVAGGSEVFSATKMGSGTSVSRQTIEALPSMNGNVQDYMRLDPRVAFVDRASGSISAGGQNPRYNAVRIDGVNASDTFGLEGNNMPTKRQPVSMEALEAINVDMSSYDITITGATGAVVDAVTKSGTNEFHGSVYGYMRDGSWFGDNPGGGKFDGFKDEKTYGATFGGPIIKDKLFFFANYEKYEQAAPGADVEGSPIGKGTISLGDIAEAQKIFQERYGVSAGDYSSASDTDLEEYALKIDWNINDAHRASLRYSKLEQSKLRVNGYSTTAASLSSYWYQHNKEIETYVAQLFSDWSDNFSTEFKASYRDFTAVRNPSAKGTPAVKIDFGTMHSSQEYGNSPYLWMGTESNTQYNELYTKTWNYFGSGQVTLGDHDLKFGADFSSNDINNVYAPYVDGYLEYVGMDAFRNNTPVQTIWRNPVSGGVDSLAAKYKYETLGLFVQDTWYVNNNLTLTMGVRADKYDTNTRPAYNKQASEYFGYNNTSIGDNSFLIQPRFGFNYTFDSDRPTQLRGGVGLFRGESPQVWLGNIFANTGVNFSQTTEYPIKGTSKPAQQVVNFVSDDFSTPSVWKANLAFDRELPWYGIVGSAEFLYSKVKDGLYFKRLELVKPSYVAGPDQRDFFWKTIYGTTGTSKSTAPSWVSDAVLLDNTDKGRTAQFTASLSKPFSEESDWAWTLGYTYTDAKEVASNTSSVATSNWNNNYIFQANEDALARSRYEIRDRVSGSLNWKHKFFADYETQVGLFYEGRTGRAYSWVYSNDMNGDGRTYNDLFYVPKGRGDVIFKGGAAMEEAFFKWMDANPELARYAGSVAPQNSGRAGFVNTFDVRITQQLPGFMKGHKSEIWLDVQNIGNMLNKKWGRIYDYGFYADQGVANFIGVDQATGKYIYDFRAERQGNQSATLTEGAYANADADGFNTGVSQWSLQLGFRYKF